MKIKMEDEVRKRYARIAGKLALALEVNDAQEIEILFGQLGRVGAWSLRHAVDRYALAMTEAIAGFSRALATVQEVEGFDGPQSPREHGTLINVAEESVHRTLDAVERALGELDHLRQLDAQDRDAFQESLNRTRLALRDILAMQGFQDQLGQLVARCVSLVDTLAGQLDGLLQFSEASRHSSIDFLGQLLEGNPQEQLISQQQIDALLDVRNAPTHGS